MSRLCVVVGCALQSADGKRTCPAHAEVEDRYHETNQAMFSMRTRLLREAIARPTDDPGAVANEAFELELDCPEKPSDGVIRVRAQFGRTRTHNEQLFVRPCGIITCRETFYGSETVPQVLVRVCFLSKQGELTRTRYSGHD